MGKDGKTVTEAQKRATAKYEKQNYDKILLRLKKGTKDRIIQYIGEDGSINGFIVELIERELSLSEDRQKRLTRTYQKTDRND